MTDIDSSHRLTLTSFGAYQAIANPAGIGNECTHWIYAALFEARALQTDQHLKKGDGHFTIGQTGVPKTWGRPITPSAAQPGDIAQFRNFSNTFFRYQKDVASGNWDVLNTDKPEQRGPDHTGMVFTPPTSGAYYQLESHLHQPGVPRMRVRRNTIYFESFAIALSAEDLQQIPSSVNTSDMRDMREHIDWAGMRNKASRAAERVTLSIPMHTANTLIARIKQNDALRASNRNLLPIEVHGSEVFFLFVPQAFGELRFYCPQGSDDRLGMDASRLAKEKARVIDILIRTGEEGDDPSGDAFGDDNKAARIQNGFFDWSYPGPTWVDPPNWR